MHKHSNHVQLTTNLRVTSFTLGRLPQLQTNAITVDLPSIHAHENLEPWMPYGATGPGPPSAKSTTFQELAQLSKIVNSTLQMFFAPSTKISGRLYLDEHQKYLDWFKKLPEILAITANAPSHVLCLQ